MRFAIDAPSAVIRPNATRTTPGTQSIENIPVQAVERLHRASPDGARATGHNRSAGKLIVASRPWPVNPTGATHAEV
jgi:hypothetical protein